MMKAGLPLLLVLVACAVLCVSVTPVSAVRGSVRRLRRTVSSSSSSSSSPSSVDSSLAEVSAQVDSVLAIHKEEEDKEAHAQKNLALKNTLDLKTQTVDLTPGKKQKQPRSVVVAFLSIAWEALQRGVTVAHNLETAVQTITNGLKAHMTHIDAWVKAQTESATKRIEAEKTKVALLKDEITHLAKVNKDATGKQESYIMQAKQLTTERQLQTTPPLMPSVAAGALTEAQFKETIAKLDHYKAAAAKIIEQSKAGIESRERLVELGNKWINKSESTLETWTKNQAENKDKQKQIGEAQLSKAQTRLANVKIIVADVKKRHAEYVQALHKVDIQDRLAQLENQLNRYKGAKGVTSYDAVQAVTYVESLKLEIKALTEALSKASGDAQVVPPPAQWGVLSGFGSPWTQAPLKDVKDPALNHAGVDPTRFPQANPDLAWAPFAPGGASLDHMTGGASASASGSGSASASEEAASATPKPSFKETFANSVRHEPIAPKFPAPPMI